MIKNRKVMKKNVVWAFAATFLTGGLFASCSDNNGSGDNGEAVGESSFVIAAVVDEAGQLLTASSLDEGTVAVGGSGLITPVGTYWVFFGERYLYRLNYNQGSAGVSASYELNPDGQIEARANEYSMKRFTTYGTYAGYIITLSNGDRDSRYANPDGDLPQGLQIAYIDTEEEYYYSAEVDAENYLGNGEYVTLSGVLEANGKIYSAVIPMGMSVYGVKEYPGDVIYPDLVKTQTGGSSSSAYVEGELQWTQHPDEAWVAIYNDENFEDPVKIRTDKISYACGRYRSQYYQTLWAAGNGDVYVFSSSYAKTMTDSRQQTTKPAGVVRIRSGAADFDPDYYFDIEAATGGKSFLRCWHLEDDCFLLRMYDEALTPGVSSISIPSNSMAIYKGESKTLTYVTGLPAPEVISSYGDAPYCADGKAYIAVTATSDEYPAIYKIDVATAAATKGITVQATSIAGIGRLTSGR